MFPATLIQSLSTSHADFAVGGGKLFFANPIKSFSGLTRESFSRNPRINCNRIILFCNNENVAKIAVSANTTDSIYDKGRQSNRFCSKKVEITQKLC